MTVYACANLILEAFNGDRTERRALMRLAQTRFETANWAGLQADAVERLNIRERYVQMAARRTQDVLGQHARDVDLWEAIKHAYGALCAGHPALDFTRSFFNTVTRRMFDTPGIDPRVEFHGADFDFPTDPNQPPVFIDYAPLHSWLALAQHLLDHVRLNLPWQDRSRDAEQLAHRLRYDAEQRWGPEASADRAEILKPIFFRGKTAFVVGRLWHGAQAMPLVLALCNQAGQVLADALLTDDDDVSIIFSFTRSYFHVDLPYPRGAVLFLKSLMPWKRLSDLYISLGYPRHGKAELFRELLQHLEHSQDQFVPAPGDRGMVMAVFTLPSFDIVFKLIRDTFAYPKTTTREDVLQKYALVFNHDRAGRLVDAQEFRGLALPRHRFHHEVLHELTTATTQSVAITDTHVILKHVYLERRITPLNLYLREAPIPQALDAVLDYGQAIKDLAATNIFTGDLLLKNFGVTRHQRVVFYDYDELARVTECNFRDLPTPSDDDDDWRGEPWFYVGDKDIFPEEFLTFIGLHGEQRRVFLEHHHHLLTPHFWRGLQQRLNAGEIMDILPYRPSRCLHSY